MFAKKRTKPWFVHALLNLAAVSVVYRLARGFLKLAQGQEADRKIQKGKGKRKKL